MIFNMVLSRPPLVQNPVTLRLTLTTSTATTATITVTPLNQLAGREFFIVVTGTKLSALSLINSSGWALSRISASTMRQEYELERQSLDIGPATIQIRGTARVTGNYEITVYADFYHNNLALVSITT